MSDNVTLPGTGAPVETLDIGAGVERQVVTISPRDRSAGDSIGSLTEAAPASDTASSGLNGRLQRVAQNLTSILAKVSPLRYLSPKGSEVATSTTLGSILSDDFGGVAVDTTNTWDVLDGGLAAIVSGTPVAQLHAAPTPAFSQGAIGSGITGITDSVATSGLTVAMGTTLGAERWYLSQKAFAGKEDILVILSKSQPIAANSIFIGLVEVDPVTFIPLLNLNFAADGNGSSEFTNRGGVEVGQTVTTTAYQAEAIGDSSPGKATGAVGLGIALTTTQEFLVEIDTRDVIVSTMAVDSVASKAAGASRVSSQCPNDTKLYKLLMRFRNVATPATGTNVVIQRVIVVDNYEQRVQVSTGEGDLIANKAMAVNIAGSVSTALTPTTTVATVATQTGTFVDPDALLIADIVSGAIVSTTTTATISPKTAGGVAAFEIGVTAASGTLPTMDVAIQESLDSGVNHWVDVYHFERITTTGQYTTPPLHLSGNKLRYAQTITGTSPSFTRTLNRLTQPFCDDAGSRVYRIYDRVVAINTISSNTASLKTRGCKNLSLTLNLGTVATTLPQLQLQGSDDNGVSWYSIGATLTGVASASVNLTVANVNAELVRATVAVAGGTAVLGYVSLKAFG